MKTIDLQNHLDELAHSLGCRLDQITPNTPGMMYVEFGYVEGPVLSGPNIQSKYMVNLHELGHYAHGHTQGRPPMQNETWYFANGVLKSEAEAWEWALDNSLLNEYDKETRNYMWNTCMGSYYRGAIRDGIGVPGRQLWNGNRHHVKFAWDEPDDYFWATMERMSGESRTVYMRRNSGIYS